MATKKDTPKSAKAPLAPLPPVTVRAPVVLEAGETRLRLVVLDTHALFVAILLALVIAFFWTIRGVLVPLLFVGVLTFLGAPIVARLETRMPRAAAAGVFIVAAVLLFVALLALVLPPLITDLVHLFQNLPQLWRDASAWAEARFGFVVPTTLAELSTEASRDFLEQLGPVASTGGGIAKAGALGVLKGAAGAAGFLGKAALIPVLAFFVLTEWPRTKAMLEPFVPRASRGVLAHYRPLVEDTLGALVRGQLVVASLMAVVYMIGLSVSGVPLALAIAVISGVAYLIPFASASVCLVLSALFAVLELKGASGGPIIGAAITCVVVQIVESYVLTPRIVGEKAGLSPLAAILAVLLGGTAGGFLGVLFALPIGAVLALVLREESRRRGGFLVDAYQPEPLPKNEAKT
jgi:predicted PurR-regulated permease PerM